MNKINIVNGVLVYNISKDCYAIPLGSIAYMNLYEGRSGTLGLAIISNVTNINLNEPNFTKVQLQSIFEQYIKDCGYQINYDINCNGNVGNHE